MRSIENAMSTLGASVADHRDLAYLVIMTALVAMAWAAWSEHRKRKGARETKRLLTERLQAARERYVALCQRYEVVLTASASWPRWIVEREDPLYERAEHAKHWTSSLLRAAEGASLNTAEERIAQILALTTLQNDLAGFEGFLRVLEAVPYWVQEGREAAALRVQDAYWALAALERRSKDLTERTLDLAQLCGPRAREDLRAKRVTLERLLIVRPQGPEDTSDLIMDLASDLCASAAEHHRRLDRAVQLLDSAESLAAEIGPQVKQAMDNLPLQEARVERLRAELSAKEAARLQRLWQGAMRLLGSIATNMQQLPSRSQVTLGRLRHAQRRFLRCRKHLNQVRVVWQEIEHLEERLERAKHGGYREMLDYAGQALLAVSPLLDDNRVGAEPRQLNERARKMKLDAVILARRDGDWLGAVELLSNCLDAVRRAKHLAERHIAWAEKR